MERDLEKDNEVRKIKPYKIIKDKIHTRRLVESL